MYVMTEVQFNIYCLVGNGRHYYMNTLMPQSIPGWANIPQKSFIHTFIFSYGFILRRVVIDPEY